jgi:phosphate uptake regulator
VVIRLNLSPAETIIVNRALHAYARHLPEIADTALQICEAIDWQKK